MEKLSHAYIVSSASEEAGLERALALASEMLCSGTGKKPCGVCRDWTRNCSDLIILSRTFRDLCGTGKRTCS